MLDIKLLEKELATSYKDCIKSHWDTKATGYYAGQIQIVKLLGYEVVTNNGNLKLVKKGENNA